MQCTGSVEFDSPGGLCPVHTSGDPQASPNFAVMKSVLALMVFAGLAKYCTKYDPYAALDRNPHPDYVHKMEITLADDLNADDSATAATARQFLDEFEIEFRAYQPDKKIIAKLSRYKNDLMIKVIGGNWCSDTRREIPRLCKVLYYTGLPVESYEYYRVSRDKKPLGDDFSATRKVGLVPEIVVYYKEKDLGSIREVPRKSLEADILDMITTAD